MLKLEIKGHKEPVSLDKDRITVGRADSNSVVLQGADVSGYHAEIHCDGGDVWLVDLGSTNGTKLNGNVLKERRKLKAWDTVSFGSTEAEVVDTEGRRPTQVMRAVGAAGARVLRSAADVPWKLVGAEGEFALTGRHVLGRGDGCDIRLRSQSVSRRHAEFTVKAGRLTVKDLGSSNGTFVNGKRVEQRVLRPTDEVRFDEETFRVHGPTDLDRTSLRPAVGGDATKVSRAVGTTVTSTVERPAARLEVVAGMSSTSFELTRDSYVVGRSPQADIVLSVDSVSARHAELTRRNGAWRLTDLRSTNGSFVGKRRVESTDLKPGDEVRLGEVRLRFVAPGGASAGTAVHRAAMDRTLDQPGVGDATVEGIPGMPPPEQPRAVPPWAWAAGAAFVVLGAFALFTWARSEPDATPSAAAEEVASAAESGAGSAAARQAESGAGPASTTTPASPTPTPTPASTSTRTPAAINRAATPVNPPRQVEPPAPRVERPDPPAPRRSRSASLRGGSARLVVETSPPGVKVSLNGEPVGVTPVELEGLTPGSRTIVLDHDVYRTVRLSNQVLENDTTLRINREMAFGLGKLTVVATPREVMVEVDGLLRATETPVTIEGVRAGRRRVTLRAAGHETMSETIEIRKDEITELERTLTPEW